MELSGEWHSERDPKSASNDLIPLQSPLSRQIQRPEFRAKLSAQIMIQHHLSGKEMELQFGILTE
jgi:hypothetical protein